MRLAISNLAWDVAEDEDVARLLRDRRVDAIDVAPGKYFPDPSGATDDQLRDVRRWWADRGIEITGMQALLFGVSGANLFGAPASQRVMLDRLTAICRVGRVLGAPRLVFGSPKNRDRGTLGDEETMAIARDFFRRLGDVAADEGVVICLEPNPPRYGANFMTTSAETARVVEAVDHPAIRMQLDTGALAIQGEDPQQVLASWAAHIGHVHASEPDLVPLGDGGAPHARVFAALTTYLPDPVVTIEMLATRDEPHLASIGRALSAADRVYRPTDMGHAP